LASVQPTPALAQGTPCAAFVLPPNTIEMHLVYRDVNNHI
jgi:hypothetical protein